MNIEIRHHATGLIIKCFQSLAIDSYTSHHESCGQLIQVFPKVGAGIRNWADQTSSAHLFSGKVFIKINITIIIKIDIIIIKISIIIMSVAQDLNETNLFELSVETQKETLKRLMAMNKVHQHHIHLLRCQHHHTHQHDHHHHHHHHHHPIYILIYFDHFIGVGHSYCLPGIWK